MTAADAGAADQRDCRMRAVGNGVERLGDARQVYRRLHARQVRHVPRELVDGGHHAVVDAALGLRFGDDVDDARNAVRQAVEFALRAWREDVARRARAR